MAGSRGYASISPRFIGIVHVTIAIGQSDGVWKLGEDRGGCAVGGRAWKAHEFS